MSQDTRRADYLWASVVAKHYLEGIREGYASDQSADSAVKHADHAEWALIKPEVKGSADRRLDLIWALVAADEFARLLTKSIEPNASEIKTTADLAVESVSGRPSIAHLISSGKP